MGSSEYGDRRIIRKQNVDRIINLPDEVISLILSLLPTKDAVGTSILSNRWKYLWTAITCLNFKSPSGSDTDSNVVDFTNFVDHMFQSYNSSHIQKLILHCPRLGASRVKTWMDEGIMRSISELDLYVLMVPVSVFSCTTLTVLTLRHCYYDYNDAKVVSFDLPCLKVLHIKGVFSPLTEKLITNCPVLEELTLGGPDSYNLSDTFMVSAHTLKTLRLKLNQYHSFAGEISVEAPNLEYLHLSETFIHYNIKGIFSSLVKAYVSIGNISMRHHFQDLPRRFTLPNFSYLTCLEVISFDNSFWVMLPKFIRSTPSLEVLFLKQDGDDNVIDDEYDWVKPKSVAKCMGHHLGVIKVEGFKGRLHELQLVKYFLGSAKVLKTLTVACQGLKQEEEIKFVGKLLDFSRASKDCNVKFHGNFISNL